MPRFLIPLVAASTVCLAPFADAQSIVYRVPVVGEVTIDLVGALEHVLEIAAYEGAAAIILDLDSRGGRMDAAQLLVNSIENAEISIYALINRNAWGPAALVALAADSIFMGPRSSLGAGSPSPYKNLPRAARNALLNEFRSIVERRQLDPRIGQAMVDDQVAIVGLVESGTLLTLSREEALRTGVAAGRVDDLPDLFQRLHLAEVEVRTVGKNWSGVTVSIENNNWSSVRVSVVRGGSRMRLGNVTSMNSETFEIPSHFLSTGSLMHLLAEVIDGSRETAVTERIQVRPGLVIQWQIENVLSQSSYFFFQR